LCKYDSINQSWVGYSFIGLYHRKRNICI